MTICRPCHMSVVEAAAPYNQRWREGRVSYRPARETINTLNYEIAPIPSDNEARQFIIAEHYSSSYPAARRWFGLYRRGGALVGVAVLGHPTNNRTITNAFPWAAGRIRSVMELLRFVLLDDVEANGETFFLGQCFRLLRRDEKEEFAGILSFSDPIPRVTEDGRVILRGHIGGIYQSFSADFRGLGTPRTLRIFKKTGTVFSDRTAQKIRKLEKGWHAAVKELEALGARPLGDAVFGAARRRAWLKEATARLTYPLRHPGNLRYTWVLDKRRRKLMPPRAGYPKWDTLDDVYREYGRSRTGAVQFRPTVGRDLGKAARYRPSGGWSGICH